MVNTVHPNEYRSLRGALLWQNSQFGSGVALHRFRQSKRGATEPLRLFVTELHDLARQAYTNCDMQSRLSLVMEQFIATLTDTFTQRLCSIESDAPLERLVNIIEKSEQFNRCTVLKPDNGGIYSLATSCCHETNCHNTFASDDAEMDALMSRLNVLETRSQCNHNTPISS